MKLIFYILVLPLLYSCHLQGYSTFTFFSNLDHYKSMA